MNNALLYGLTVLVWGSTWFAVKFQLGTVDPALSVVYRFALAAVLLFAWCGLRGLRLRFSLRDHGYAVDVLDDGEAADTFLSTQGADLAVIDVNLPGLNGFELLRRMRQRGDTTAVLMLTARGETRDKVLGLDAGADDYMVKPFEIVELLARIRVLSRRRNDLKPVKEQIGALTYDRGEPRAAGQPQGLGELRAEHGDEPEEDEHEKLAQALVAIRLLPPGV